MFIAQLVCVWMKLLYRFLFINISLGVMTSIGYPYKTKQNGKIRF